MVKEVNLLLHSPSGFDTWGGVIYFYSFLKILSSPHIKYNASSFSPLFLECSKNFSFTNSDFFFVICWLAVLSVINRSSNTRGCPWLLLNAFFPLWKAPFVWLPSAWSLCTSQELSSVGVWQSWDISTAPRGSKLRLTWPTKHMAAPLSELV